MVRWKRDVIYAIGLLVFSIAGWIIAGTFVQKNISVWAAYPSTYCRGVLTILGVLAILQLIRALHEKPKEVLPVIWTKQSVITVIALALYVYFLNKVGFLLATIILCSILTFSYTAGLGKFDTANRKKLILQIVLYMLVAVAMAAAMYVIFGVLLKAKLPAASLW